MSRHRSFLFAALACAAALLALSAAADDLDLCNKSIFDPDAGIPACTRILEHPANGVNVAAIFNNRGAAKVHVGDLAGAIKDFTGALDRSPKFPDAIKNRGIAFQLQGDFAAALMDFNRALRLGGPTADLLNARGTTLLSKEEYDRAIADFDQALALDPRFAPAFVNRGQAWLFKRHTDRAIADFNAFLRIKPGDPLGYFNRAAARMDKADFEGAISDYDEIIKRDPNNGSAYTGRGEAWRLQGDLGRSLADHDKAIKLSPNETAYNNRALALKDKGELDKALADCDEALLLNPKFYLAYANRGLIRRLKGDLRGALADLDKALTLDPRSPIALSFRGDVFRDAGGYERALKDFNEAIRLLPDFVPGYVGRGLNFERMGDRAKAKNDFEKALSLPAEADAGLARPAQSIAKARLAALALEEAVRVKEAAEHAAQKNTEKEARADNRRGPNRTENEQAVKAAATAEAERAKADFEAKLRAEMETRLKVELEARTKALLDAAQASPPIHDVGNRIALVVGNSNYREVPALPNPQRDAEAVAEAFRKIGFQTVISVSNVTRESFLAALRSFEEKIEQADWAVIYYAGHGFEMDNTNYLIPIDAKLRSDRDVQDEAIPLDRLLLASEGAKKLRLIILDACRDNPFLARMRRTVASRSIGRGLAVVEPAGGTLVAYATKDGQTALDGSGPHSPFTQAFLNNVIKPRVEINMLFRLIHDEVISATRGSQVPFTYGSLPGESFYFVAK